MEHNSNSEIVIDKLADIDASIESWNIRAQVVMIWKQTYKNNPNMVNSFDMILMDQEGTRIHATIKKNLINAFQALLEEGAVRQITNFGMARNEGDYMINPFNFESFHDVTARNFDTRVAFDFIGQVVSTEPMRVIKENARETRLMSIVAQDLIGRKMQVALWDSFTLKLNSYISEHQNENALVIILLCMASHKLHINDDMHHISEFKKANCCGQARRLVPPFQIKNIDDIPDYNEEGWYSFYCRNCSKKVTKNGDDSDGEPFNCNGYGGVFDVFDKVRVGIHVQDETGSASFVLFDRHVKDLIHRGNHWLMEKISKDQGHQKIPDEFNTMLNRKFVFKVQISKFNLENNYHTYTVHKMADDELVLGAVFKHSPAYEENSIHSDGTPINKSIKEKSVSVEGDNINVVDLDAVTPTTTSLKRPIEIVTTTELFEWSSSKDSVAPHTLKIPKMENSNEFCSNDVVALLNKVSLLIWDEVPMMHRHCFEAVDRTLRDTIPRMKLTRSDKKISLCFQRRMHQ
uniref:ATP-dependent DNA helicase n=1 Tax=Lactuca sativa TaxID=4236 RepID=A0A9R1XRW5_LACSA|nr:hypothetical protein LSAT_V11C200100110 [Lactuca sativa]